MTSHLDCTIDGDILHRKQSLYLTWIPTQEENHELQCGIFISNIIY